MKVRVITPKGLNVRKGNGKQYDVVRILQPGEEILLIKIGKVWGQIAEGEWVMLEFVEEVKEEEVKEESDTKVNEGGDE